MKIEQLHKEFLASGGVSTDTRTLTKGQVFFALKGERFDGNVFVPAALEKGCRLVVSDDPQWSGNGKVLVTDSALRTLQDLAAYHRKSKELTLLAITGSNGKTTTRELIGRVLSMKYNTLVTTGNLNNHIGVPLTLLRLKNEEMAVIEMGANHRNEIGRLCEIADPDLGLITNIGKAHLEGFGSLEGIRKGKGELFDHLAKYHRKAFVNIGDPVVSEMAGERSLEIIPFAVGPGRPLSGIPRTRGKFIGGTISYQGSSWEINSSMTGAYNFSNIMAAVAAGLHFEVPVESIQSAVESFQPDNNRSQLLKGTTTTIFLDAYNANPTSMHHALQNFLDFSSKPRMVILGDMLELGDETGKEHRSLLEFLADKEIDRVMLVGEHFLALRDTGYPYEFFRDIGECISQLRTDRLAGFHIMLKGSRKIALEKATKVLLDC